MPSTRPDDERSDLLTDRAVLSPADDFAEARFMAVAEARRHTSHEDRGARTTVCGSLNTADGPSESIGLTVRSTSVMRTAASMCSLRSVARPARWQVPFARRKVTRLEPRAGPRGYMSTSAHGGKYPAADRLEAAMAFGRTRGVTLRAHFAPCCRWKRMQHRTSGDVPTLVTICR